MREPNTYKIKNLGSKVRGFNHQRWRRVSKQTAFKAVYTKFSQNMTLKSILLNTGNGKIAESYKDPYWGTGIHLYERVALDSKHWKAKEGGVMREILSKV